MTFKIIVEFGDWVKNKLEEGCWDGYFGDLTGGLFFMDGNDYLIKNVDGGRVSYGYFLDHDILVNLGAIPEIVLGKSVKFGMFDSTIIKITPLKEKPTQIKLETFYEGQPNKPLGDGLVINRVEFVTAVLKAAEDFLKIAEPLFPTEKRDENYWREVHFFEKYLNKAKKAFEKAKEK